MKMQLVIATLLMKTAANNPLVLRPAPFAKGGYWGISRRYSLPATSFSCAGLYRSVHELLGLADSPTFWLPLPSRFYSP
jgi:hypothetical protein